MGLNQSLSCHAASSCAVIPTSGISWAGPYTGSIKDSSVMQPCTAAKVLLLDGRVLHFTGFTTALQVLASFPNHCLCPLDSLSEAPPRSAFPVSSTDPAGTITTFFRPVCLQPHDLLRLNCVYILLPRKTFRLFAKAATAATRASMRRCSTPNGSRVTNSAYCTSTDSCSSISSRKGNGEAYKLCACGSTVYNGSSRDARIGSRQVHESNDKFLGATILQDTNRPAAPDSTVCGPNPIGGVQHRPAACTAGTTLQSVTSVKCPPTPISSTLYHFQAPHRSRSLDLHRFGYSSQHQHHRSRPLGMRRCRSWRPRLQAINEVQAYS